MQKSSLCSFMWGDLTNDETKKKVEDALKNNHAENVEVLIYKKNSKKIFILIKLKNLMTIYRRFKYSGYILQSKKFFSLCKICPRVQTLEPSG